MPLPTTQRQLAEALGVDANRLNQWIKRADICPPAFAILNISRLYGFGPPDAFIIAHQNTVLVREVLDAWFEKNWRSWYDPSRRRGKGEVESFVEEYRRAASADGLVFFSPIRCDSHETHQIIAHIQTGNVNSNYGSSNNDLKARRDRFINRLIGIDLNGVNNISGYFSLIITVIIDGETPLLGSAVGVTQVEVGLQLERCIVRERDNIYLTRPALAPGGINLNGGSAKVKARGNLGAPKWIFNNVEEGHSLDGAYSTDDPPACDIKIQHSDWCLIGEAVIRPLHLVITPGNDEINKSRIIDRIRELAIFDRDDEVIIRTTLRRHEDA